MNDNRFEFDNFDSQREMPNTQTPPTPPAHTGEQPATAGEDVRFASEASNEMEGASQKIEPAEPADMPMMAQEQPTGQAEPMMAQEEEARPEGQVIPPMQQQETPAPSAYDAQPLTETAAGTDYSAPQPHTDIESGGSYTVPRPTQPPIYPEGASDMQRQSPYGFQNTPPYGARPAQQTPYQPYGTGQPPRAFGSPAPVQGQAPKQKKEKKQRKFSMGAVVGVAVASALLCSVISSSVVSAVMINASGVQASQTGSNGTNKTVYVDSKTETSIATIAEKVSPSVVGIRVTAASSGFNPFGNSGSSVGEGSGVIYKEDGYIITNYHVISDAVEGGSNSSTNPYGIYGNNQQSSSKSTIEVFLPSDPETGIQATVVGYDVSADLAILKIEKTGLPAIEIGDSDALTVGDTAIAIGNPGGLQFMGSVSTGIISGLNRTITTESGTEMNLIQTDAAINPGNSGGALVNIGGQLIGINNSKMAGDSYEGMGFSIPVNEVVSIADRIINNQSSAQPYLGVTINQNYTSDMLERMGYPAGVVVYSVAENSPAADAGIQANDIITAINGTEVTSYAQLTSEKNKYAAGDTVKVTVFRNGQSADLDVVLATAN